jgi:hypothetical protein
MILGKIEVQGISHIYEAAVMPERHYRCGLLTQFVIKILILPVLFH